MKVILEKLLCKVTPTLPLPCPPPQEKFHMDDDENYICKSVYRSTGCKLSMMKLPCFYYMIIIYTVRRILCMSHSNNT